MARIVVFDSGVGGLSVLQALMDKMPEQEYVFVSDNAAFPYGTKDDAQLVSRVGSIISEVLETVAPDIVVIACNTASTIALPSLRAAHSTPFVGVVPAIKPAARISRTKTIGLLATPATIARPYTAKLVEDFASDCELIYRGSSELVELVEQKLAGAVLDPRQLYPIVQPFLDNPQCDVLVLACTHFPLINSELEEIFDANSHSMILLDSGQAIARRVEELLQAGLDSAHPGKSRTNNRSLFSKPLSKDSGLVGILANMGVPCQADWSFPA